MNLSELFVLNEGASVVWQRRNGEFKKLYRATSGSKFGRLYATPEECMDVDMPVAKKEIRTPIEERLKKAGLK